MAIEPIESINATSETTAARAAGDTFLSVPLDPKPIDLADASVAQLEALAHDGDQAAIAELALRAKLATDKAAEHHRTTDPLPIPHSPPEPGKGIELDISA